MAYNKVVIPDDKLPKDYTYIERRADILKMIIAAGHPGLISQTKLAGRYGKSQAMISHDIDAIKKDLDEHMGTDAKLITHSIYNKVIKELVGTDPFKAVQVVEKWNEYLFNIGKQVKVAQRVEIESNNKTEYTIADAIAKRAKEEKESESNTNTGPGS